MMHDQTNVDEIDTVVRSLALKAVGMTGADIERILREARRTARREKRACVYNDIAAGLESGKPKRSEASRWRRAVHEAGHAVARYHLQQGAISTITINGPNGRSYVDGHVDLDAIEMEDAYEKLIITILAGRAAEETLLGRPSLGSGGSEQSDLAKATEIALALETVLGTSAHCPLLHVTTIYPIDPSVTINIGEVVNRRLEKAYVRSLELVMRFQPRIIKIAEDLVHFETLDKNAVKKSLDAIE